MLTPGDTFLVNNTFHDFFGDIKIWERYHLTILNGEAVVDRYYVNWTGCP